MNREEFRKIASEVIHEISNDMLEKGVSSETVFATSLHSMIVTAKLIDRLFDGDEEIEIER